jgi:signal transduction histidine kinase
VPATGCGGTAAARRVSHFARLPIRLRLTLAFALVLGAILTATGLFLYFRLEAQLDRSLDQGLRNSVDDIAAVVGPGGAGLRDSSGSRLTDPEEHFAQVLDPGGAVVDGTPFLGSRPLLTGAELERASRETFSTELPSVPGSDDPVRLLATPVDAGGRRLVVAVGSSLEPRDEALGSLLVLLLVGGPIALALGSLAAYGLAAAALRPVESMRREAEAVSAAEPGRRLPLPAARDEIARLGETLNRMLGRLETALARERRFVADASHELRTPLAALRTELELALRRPRTPDELEHALRSAGEEVERLTQLAEDLLVLARADAGRLPVRRERLAAAELLGGVRERYARRAEEAGRPLDVRVDDALELSVDRLRAEQALGNLVENALRHGRGRIGLGARLRDGQVELHVTDEGAGFPPGFADQAFEPFSRGDPARSSPGAGLGLAIVAVIARAHGGAAHVANVDGGADAWLELPADAGDAGSATATAPSAARSRPRSSPAAPPRTDP